MRIPDLYSKFFPHEDGQGLVEYALILVLMIIIVLVALFLLGPSVGNLYTNVVENVATVTPAP